MSLDFLVTGAMPLCAVNYVPQHSAQVGMRSYTCAQGDPTPLLWQGWVLSTPSPTHTHTMERDQCCALEALRFSKNPQFGAFADFCGISTPSVTPIVLSIVNNWLKPFPKIESPVLTKRPAPAPCWKGFPWCQLELPTVAWSSSFPWKSNGLFIPETGREMLKIS